MNQENKIKTNPNINKLINKCELKLKDIYDEIDEICEFNSKKVLESFWNNHISEVHFNSTT